MLAESNLPFGPYRLTRLLGRGGMAEVWRGLTLADDGTSTTLAVKRILSFGSLLMTPALAMMSL